MHFAFHSLPQKNDYTESVLCIKSFRTSLDNVQSHWFTCMSNSVFHGEFLKYSAFARHSGDRRNLCIVGKTVLRDMIVAYRKHLIEKHLVRPDQVQYMVHWVERFLH
jgi:hypothetical protein